MPKDFVLFQKVDFIKILSEFGLLFEKIRPSSSQKALGKTRVLKVGFEEEEFQTETGYFPRFNAKSITIQYGCMLAEKWPS